MYSAPVRNRISPWSVQARTIYTAWHSMECNLNLAGSSCSGRVNVGRYMSSNCNFPHMVDLKETPCDFHIECERLPISSDSLGPAFDTVIQNPFCLFGCYCNYRFHRAFSEASTVRGRVYFFARTWLLSSFFLRFRDQQTQYILQQHERFIYKPWIVSGGRSDIRTVVVRYYQSNGPYWSVSLYKWPERMNGSTKAGRWTRVEGQGATRRGRLSL